MNKRILILGLLFLIALQNKSLHAQVEIGGEAVFEISKGGNQSNFIYNEIPNEFRNWHPSITQFNLFVNALIGESFEFNGRVLFDTWGTGRLNSPRIALASLNWIISDDLSASFGRILSPIGLFPRRQLLSQSLFANSPLTYNYHTKISDQRGFWGAAGTSGTAYTTDDVGTTTLNFAAYTTGASINLRLISDAMNLELAVLAASANQSLYTNLANFAVAGRLGVSPFIFWQQGFSASYGGFMQGSGVNAIARENRAFENYRQLTVSTDITLAYSYFELTGEAFYSKWNVPRFTNAAGFETNAAGNLVEYSLENISGYVDFKYEPDFFTGSFIAVRYEKMIFPKYTHPTTALKETWDTDIQRISMAIGYKLTRGVLLKVAVSDQALSGQTWQSIDDYTFRAMIIATF
ncbi:MAG: hypothetical protein SFU91_07950 [Chloroherpetonaceae bacterium]|nr:hypothetical protein [Chloroherpetonaceae bacterium]